mmetsp:Transcript_24343/g.51639  ORF Transcript_24343/g.51639 Transcript_24343/m.51639 type:complete len:218 (-) Transcript_24343:1165-1818(-)
MSPQRPLQLTERHGQYIFDRGVGNVIYGLGSLDPSIVRLSRQITEYVQWILGILTPVGLIFFILFFYGEFSSTFLDVGGTPIHLTHFKSQAEILRHYILHAIIVPLLLFHLGDHASRLIFDGLRIRKYSGGIQILGIHRMVRMDILRRRRRRRRRTPRGRRVIPSVERPGDRLLVRTASVNINVKVFSAVSFSEDVLQFQHEVEALRPDELANEVHR